MKVYNFDSISVKKIVMSRKYEKLGFHQDVCSILTTEVTTERVD